MVPGARWVLLHHGPGGGVGIPPPRMELITESRADTAPPTPLLTRLVSVHSRLPRGPCAPTVAFTWVRSTETIWPATSPLIGERATVSTAHELPLPLPLMAASVVKSWVLVWPAPVMV